jgi:hypothetical protein
MLLFSVPNTKNLSSITILSQLISLCVSVLSDEFELVSARTEFLPLNQHKVGATRPERLRGSV